MIIAALASCGTIYTGVSGGDGYQSAALNAPATPQDCQNALVRAQQKLTDFSASQEKTGEIDVGALRKMLNEAASAQQTKDFNSCTVKAQNVASYVQRDQNYIQWDRSLSP